MALIPMPEAGVDCRAGVLGFQVLGFSVETLTPNTPNLQPQTQDPKPLAHSSWFAFHEDRVLGFSVRRLQPFTTFSRHVVRPGKACRAGLYRMVLCRPQNSFNNRFPYATVQAINPQCRLLDEHDLGFRFKASGLCLGV